MKGIRSLTGVILPDGRINFHLSFVEGEPQDSQLRRMASIMDQAEELSPEMQEIMVEFADYLHLHYPRKPG